MNEMKTYFVHIILFSSFESCLDLAQWFLQVHITYKEPQTFSLRVNKNVQILIHDILVGII